MKNPFKQRIKYKLIALILAVTLSALIPYLVFVSISHVKQLRKDMKDYTIAIARHTGYNSVSALAFEDRDDARKTLEMLEVIPEVQNAAIFNPDGRLFAEYRAANAPVISFANRHYGASFLNGSFIVYDKVIYQDRYFGDILLRVSTSELDQKIWNYLTSIIVFILFLLSMAVFLSWRLQRYISSPILHLAESFEKVSHSHDYSLTLENRHNDEIGLLYDGFNNMMTQIRQRDHELNRHRENLEALVNQRTRELQDKNIELLRAKEMAETANRLKSIFLANTSHEIRTPMNAILGFTNILLEDETDPEKKFYLNTVKTSGENLLKLINNILDLSKIEANRLEVCHEIFSPRHLFYHLETMFSVKAREQGLYFTLGGVRELPAFVLGDSQRISQTLINILSNAFKFTPQGGVSLHCSYESPVLRVSVKDTGIGVPPEKQQFIFEPFTQADNSTTRKYGGTGLGLSIAKRMIQLMGGTIELHSELNKGSEFIISVPCRESSPEEQEKNESITPAPSRLAPGDHASNQNLENIGIWDDDPTSRELIASILRRPNRRIFILTDETSLIETMVEHHIHIMLISLRAGEMNGNQLNNRIKQDLRSAHIPVILYCDTEEILSSFTCQIADIIPKPITADEALNRIILTLKIHSGVQTIFIIEEDRSLTNNLSRYLEKLDYRCYAFNSALDALKQFKSGVSPDLIIIDPVIPYMDGFEFLRILKDKSSRRNLPVIFLTARKPSPTDFLKMKNSRGASRLPNEREPFLDFTEQFFSSQREAGNQRMKRWLANMAGDEPLLRILKEAIQSLPDKTAELERALLAEDYDNIRFHSHNLKGMCLNLKIADIAAISESINREAHKKNPNIHKIQRYFLELKIIIQQLPPLDDHPSVNPARERKTAPIQNIDLRILVAEDDPVNQRLIATYFNRLGAAYDIADNGATALEMLRKKNYDVVFMDIQMPVMDGLQAIREIRNDENLKRLHIIALTAHAVKGDQEKYLEAGFDDYMSKPVSSADIAERIKTVIAQRIQSPGFHL